MSIAMLAPAASVHGACAHGALAVNDQSAVAPPTIVTEAMCRSLPPMFVTWIVPDDAPVATGISPSSTAVTSSDSDGPVPPDTPLHVTGYGPAAPPFEVTT